jgi:hypothetical protein
MTSKKITKAKQIENDKEALSDARSILRIKSVEWMQEWKAAPNPFVALKRYKSAPSIQVRKRFIKAVDKAEAIYQKLTRKGANGKD